MDTYQENENQHKNICLSNLSILNVPDEGYSRNAPYALNLIYMFSFHLIFRKWFTYVLKIYDIRVFQLSHSEYRKFRNWCFKLSRLQCSLWCRESYVLYIVRYRISPYFIQSYKCSSSYFRKCPTIFTWIYRQLIFVNTDFTVIYLCS